MAEKNLNVGTIESGIAGLQSVIVTQKAGQFSLQGKYPTPVQHLEPWVNTI
ncbi:MAG TPA: hypothetical protein VK249_32140 [Anaerolineales bacterium]|nr:hypothetical protein [Anaerolineales bacterium]